MPADEQHRRQVALLVRTLPLIAPESCFALKGGTAINLFIRDMPRLSVDIDLTYVPVADRTDSLREIDAAMRRTASRISNTLAPVHVHAGKLHNENAVNRLVVRDNRAQIKIEVTPVLRGCVYESEIRAVSAAVEEQFGFAEIQVVSFADLYAGKLVAALDRQHPRDLFDVRDLLANEGIDRRLRDAFIVYLISHNRPMVEVLAPSRRDISDEFARGFSGMTEVPVSIDALIQAREDMIAGIVGDMPDAHRRFLLSFKQGAPDWSLLDVPGVETLPAVRWRMENLARMDAALRADLTAKLEGALMRTGHGGTRPEAENQKD